MTFYISIQSVSDVITNSSSEIFVVKTETPEITKDLILKIGESHMFKGDYKEWDSLSDEEKSNYDEGSGMGMELDVETWKERYERSKECVPKNKRNLYTPEVWSIEYKQSLEELKNTLFVDIDWNRKATINWIIENLFVYDTESYMLFQKDPETGRFLKIVTAEEWRKLPKTERNDA